MFDTPTPAAPVEPTPVVPAPATPTPPPAAPKPSAEPVDVLADVDKTAAPASAPTMMTMPNPPAPDTSLSAADVLKSAPTPAVSGFAKIWQTKKWLVIGGALLLLVGAAIALTSTLGTFSNPSPEPQQQNTPKDQGVSQQPSENPAVAPLSTPETGLPNDDDRDGLTNDEERKLGTNPEVADTDGDGLSDYEEVKVYGTDPLKADTDGDGYKDGDEVKNGYNPKGPGKLLEIDKMLKDTTSPAPSTPTTPPTSSNGLPTNPTTTP